MAAGKLTLQCVQCNVSFSAKRLSARFCGIPCRLKARWARLGGRPSEAGRKRNEPLVQKSCILCDEPFTVRRDNDRKLCGDVCWRLWRTASRSKPPHFTVRMRARPKPKAPRTYNCIECGKQGEITEKGKRSTYCSDACMANRAKKLRKTSGAKAAERKARKLRLRGVSVENVNPIKVLERDNWTCQLCGVKTPRKLRGSYDDRSPEVDHILPISKGGEHSYRNVQCACRRCNLTKLGKPKGQTLLFG